MKLKRMLVATAVAVSVATPALAELVVPSLVYRTGAYGPNGIPYADGYADYFALLNERDGGIGGEMVNLIECETAYNTEKGVECFEATKDLGSLVYQPLSTGITYQLIPKATAADIPILSMGYGRTSAANGKVFSHIFNFPGNYWSAASAVINHILDMEGGDIKGKKVALVYHNSAYGKEPIRTLEELAKKHGFELSLLPVDHPGQEQKSQWLQIRREKPDYVTMWGWGVMNQVAIQEAANIRFPMENFIGVWWSGSENDVIPAGMKANGYKALAMHNTGMDYPLYDDLKKYLYDTGKASGEHAGTVLYSRGLYAGMLASEGIKTAQKLTGKSNVSSGDVRDGLEALEMTEEKMASLGMPNFGPSFKVSCESHGGPMVTAIQQWDAKNKTWSLITPFTPGDMDVINRLVAEDSAAYAAENNLTERCG